MRHASPGEYPPGSGLGGRLAGVHLLRPIPQTAGIRRQRTIDRNVSKERRQRRRYPAGGSRLPFEKSRRVRRCRSRIHDGNGGLDYLQLHGHESPDTCRTLRERGYAIIKAFPIADEEDLKMTADYEGRADYFLFDTKCSGYGGSGRRFDWSVLSGYKGRTPFLLGGGIAPDSVEAVRNFRHPKLAGIDLNSGFETAPGIKDAEKLKTFIDKIKK